MSHDEEVSTHRHVKQQLDRISERDGTVRAWVHRHDDDAILGALATAPRGLLSGWTLGVKDVIDTFDLPTERGSPIYAGRTTLNDAACVALAREAGAVYAPHSFYYGPGYLASLHMAAASPGNPLMEQPYFALEAYPFGENALAEKGEVTLPTGPGLGFDPDSEFLKTYRV